MAKSKRLISDELWERIQPCIPARENTHPRGGGRKPKDDRLIFESILFVLRFGCRWNALNASGLCPSSTVHDRFRKWVAAGFFHRLRENGILDESPIKCINWSWLDAKENASDATAPDSESKPSRTNQQWRPRRQKRLPARYNSGAPV